MHRSTSAVNGRYAVAHELLHLGGTGPLGWGNLGDWTHTGDYATAARQLALRVGRAAGVGHGSRVLDAGCGRGEQLALWIEELGAARVLGLDPVQAHVLHARRRVEQRRLADRVTVARASAARPPVPLDGGYDAVVAVDAAYHFDSREDFLRAAARVLRPGARVAWTDLVLARRPGSARAMSRVHDWAARVDVPPENVTSQSDYPAHVARSGLSQLGVQWLDREVLGGFGRFAGRQLCTHAWRHPAQGWLKIAGSGFGAALMAATGSVRYGLFTATRPPA